MKRRLNWRVKEGDVEEANRMQVVICVHEEATVKPSALHNEYMLIKTEQNPVVCHESPETAVTWPWNLLP